MSESSRIDVQKQLILAIEYTIMGWYHFIYRRSESTGRSLSQLHDLSVFLWNAADHPAIPIEQLPERTVSETSIKTYRSRLSETFNISFDFQSGYVDYHTNLESERLKRVQMLTGYYLNVKLRVFSDDALYLLLTNMRDELHPEHVGSSRVLRSLQMPPDAPPLLSLYYIVVFQAAARLGLSLDLRYRTIMGRETTDRRLLPLAVVHRSPYINLVARDQGDHRIKQFPVSSILALRTDFWSRAFGAITGTEDREPFDYESYKADPEYRFLRPMRRYRFRMMGHTFYHFCHSHRRDWTLVAEESPTSYVVDILDEDWRGMMALLFEYGKYIQLIEEETVQEADPDQKGDSIPDECLQNAFPLLCALGRRVEEIQRSNQALHLPSESADRM